MGERMDKPKVTFLMLAYNKENEVERAIKSVWGQTEQNVALFIRDNGSTDRTRDICREYAEKDARVRLVRNEVNCRKDGGGSFNDGCVTRYWTPLPDDIVGEYVSIIDSDDYLEPDFVEKLYAAAKTIKAEIAVSGSSFFDEKGVVFNKRLPPPVCTRRLSRDSEVFRSNLPAMYNTFRTWWGKLFRTDFFMKYYDEAWSTISGSEYWWGAFDTLIMLRYLVHCESIVSVEQPLYNFFLLRSSTYANRSVEWVRSLEAEALYHASNRLLDHFHAHTRENDLFLLSLNWGYLYEALKAAQGYIKWPGVTPCRLLAGIASVLNCPILSYYIRGNEPMIWEALQTQIEKACQARPGDLLVFTSYLARLLYLEKLLGSDPASVLAPPLLISCLFDAENGNHLGLLFVKMVKHRTTGWYTFTQPGAPDIIQQRRLGDHTIWMQPRIDACIWDDTQEVKALEPQLTACMDSEDYEQACSLLEELSHKSPFNRTAMFCRIQLAVLTEDAELACVLACTAKVLWPLDPQMQQLCWGVLDMYTQGLPAE